MGVEYLLQGYLNDWLTLRNAYDNMVYWNIENSENDSQFKVE